MICLCKYFIKGMKDLKKLITEVIPEVTEYRKWLHRHPEPSHHEKAASEYIAEALVNIGLEPVKSASGYGISACIDGRKPSGERQRCIALRADFDALELTEKTGCDFASEKPGLMHACGHDVHAAMLLGEAKVLNELRDEFSGTVKLIFQPAEEDSLNSGAKEMIEAGVLEDPKVDAVLGQHVFPDVPVGKIWLDKHSASAASDRFRIEVRGKASHAGMAPERGIDAIVIAGQIIGAIQTVVSRRLGADEKAVISIGTIKGGERYNIIADRVIMEGTCRTVSDSTRSKAERLLREITAGIAAGSGGSAEVEYLRGLPSSLNDAELYELVSSEAAAALGKENVLDPGKTNMGGEDFAYYSRSVPSCFYFLGCSKDIDNSPPLHSSSFLPDEECMPYGIEIMVRSALRFLND